MLPSSLPLELPVGTPAVVVDPVRDFMHSKGTFTECFGLEDTEPIRQILPRLREMIKKWRMKVYPILCQSLYEWDQFGVPGLENLCTQGNFLGREPMIPETCFRATITKPQNSLYSAPREEESKAWNYICRSRHLILTGVTTTSCIQRTVKDFPKGYTQMVIPRDAVASRASRKSDEQAILDYWSEERMTNVIVVPSWKNIKFKKAMLAPL